MLLSDYFCCWLQNATAKLTTFLVCFFNFLLLYVNNIYNKLSFIWLLLLFGVFVCLCLKRSLYYLPQVQCIHRYKCTTRNQLVGGICCKSVYLLYFFFFAFAHFFFNVIQSFKIFLFFFFYFASTMNAIVVAMFIC